MLESGQELSARFVLVRRLGAGGGGAVWLAQDRDKGCFVALKVLSEELRQNVAALDALAHECERIAALDHPHVLKVDGLFRSAQHSWIAMEYVAGGDATQLRGRVSSQILRIAMDVADALAYVHRIGIVHRDVKTANVLLTSDGSVRLADFGAAALLAAPQMLQRGSPYSMSPQQWDGAPPAAADDIYAFGVMLYELLSGYPPFYPDINADKVRAERPAPLSGQLPPALVQLIDCCLEKNPAQRPAGMEIIQQELHMLVEQMPTPVTIQPTTDSTVPRVEPPGIRPPRSHDEPLRGAWQRTAQAAANEAELRRQGFRRGLGVAGILLGIIGIGVVFFALPRWVDDGRPPPQTAQLPAASQPVAPVKAPVDYAALAKARQEAEDVRRPLEDRLDKLRIRGAEQWGGAEYQQIGAALQAGDQDFAAREYVTAAEHFAKVEPLLVILEQRAGEVLKAQLETGAIALREGRAGDARAAFELALRLEEKNQVAARGLQRASTLDEVLALVAGAEQQDKDGNLIDAAEGYRKALALDADAPRAAAALSQVTAKLAGNAFASSMARGFSALAAADYAGARQAFESAGKVRPNAPEVAQALKQAEQEERTRIIAAKLDEARGHEGAERWGDALALYREILKLDSTVAFANEGAARTQPRAQLHEQLEVYLTQPERLFSAPVREAAHKTLQRARTVTHPGPVLQQQVAKLQDWVARSEVPVPVALQSDNQTQVTINRVGTLGAFAQRSLDLVPGQYTVVGTRPGYRDVRQQITVIPGAPLPPVVVRCEDKI